MLNGDGQSVVIVEFAEVVDRIHQIVWYPAHGFAARSVDENCQAVYLVVGIISECETIANLQLGQRLRSSVSVADTSRKEQGGEITAVRADRWGEHLDTVGQLPSLIAGHDLERIGFQVET